MTSELFKEEQQFEPLLVGLIILLGVVPTASVLGWGIYKQIILGEPWGDNPMSDIGLLLITLFTLMLFVGMIMLFLKSKLETEVTKWGVRYRFVPFIPAWKEIPKQYLNSYLIKKFTIFRGYGVRWGLDGVKTLNVRGTQGVELHYGKKKRLLIGSQHPNEFLKALDKMMNPDTE